MTDLEEPLASGGIRGPRTCEWIALLVLTACSKSSSSASIMAGVAGAAGTETRAVPPGTILVLNDVPIRAEEVDEIGSAFAVLEPQDTPTQLRRLALSTSIFPRIAAMSIDPARRAAAKELAASYLRALEAGELPSGPLDGPMEVERKGTFSELGFELWRAAIDLDVGRWSGIFETPGSFHILRVKSRKEGSLASLTGLTIGAFDFPFIQAETAKADIEAALDRSRLTILDASWRDSIPAALRYRFHVESP